MGKFPENIDFFRISTFSSSPTANATTKPNNILIEKEKQAKEAVGTAGHTEFYFLINFIDFPKLNFLLNKQKGGGDPTAKMELI